MKFLLDTHTFLWFVLDSPRLTITAKALIEDNNNDIYVERLWDSVPEDEIGSDLIAR